MSKEQNDIWEKLSAIDCSKYIEKKGQFAYLSWAWAWGELKKLYPCANYTVKKNSDGLPYFKDDGGVLCFVEVTIMELTHEMWLPVMDYKNRPIANPAMTDVNKTIMRCLVKCIAMFGLGHYIYAGEDLPEPDSAKSEDTISQQQYDELAKYCVCENGKEWTKTGLALLKAYKISTIVDLPASKYSEALSRAVKHANN